MEFIKIISWILFFQFIWFNTDAIVWWGRLFRLGGILRIDRWESYRLEVNPRVKYYDFIFQTYPNFLTKLISCKPCFCFWIAVSVILIFGANLVYLPAYYLVSYILYKKLIDKNGI
jgi:hypothetical protein